MKEETDETFYSIKCIKQLNEEEFEAVFEFDSKNNEIGLRYIISFIIDLLYFIFISESDLESLELFRDKNLLILGSEENQVEQKNICQAEDFQEKALECRQFSTS